MLLLNMKSLYQRKLFFENTCNCIVDCELLEEAMLWFAPNYLNSKRKIFMNGRYPAISIDGNKLHIHRLLMLYKNKNSITGGIVCHHKDGNALNNNLDNLELMSWTTHSSHHHKGKKLTSQHRRKIGIANKKRKGMIFKRKHNIPYDEIEQLVNEGKSILFISKKYGCAWSVIRKRIDELNKLYEGIR